MLECKDSDEPSPGQTERKEGVKRGAYWREWGSLIRGLVPGFNPGWGPVCTMSGGRVQGDGQQPKIVNHLQL